MALTAEEQRQIEEFYARSNHGFGTGYRFFDTYNMTLDELKRLWQMPFRDVLAEKGITSAEVAKTDKSAREAVSSLLDMNIYGYGEHRLYDFVIDRLYDEQIGSILTNRNDITMSFRKEKDEVMEDYTYQYGQKRDMLEKATDFDRIADGTPEEYFFRFWRYPVSKVLDYRHIDITTPAGYEAGYRVVTELFGSTARDYNLMELVKETPEHLVEKKEDIERNFRANEERKQLDMAVYFDKPLAEGLEHFGYTVFSTKTDTEQMAAEALSSPRAVKHLGLYLKPNAKNEIDAECFKDTLAMTPRQIQDHAATLNAALERRLDERYLADHPTETFMQFLKNRRTDISEVSSTTGNVSEQALAWLLNTTERMDQQAVARLYDTPIGVLRSDAPDYVADIKKRQKKQWWKGVGIGSAVAAAALAGIAAVYPLFNKAANRTVENTKKSVAAAEAWWNEKKPAAEAQKTAVTDDKGTNLVERAVGTAAAASNVVEKVTAPTPVKQGLKIRGNRPILKQWHGFQDLGCHIHDDGAATKLLTGEFNDILARIANTGLAFQEQFDLSDSARQVLRGHNTVVPATLEGENAVPFYLRRGTRDYDNMMTDLLNFRMNVADAMTTIPVAPEHLADAQVALGKAVGPSMGLSIKQQLHMQKKDGNKAQQALEMIMSEARHTLAEHKADTNDVEAVFWATTAAAQKYHDANPSANYLLLTVDEGIRRVAGIQLQDTAEFEQLSSRRDMAEAKARILQADREVQEAVKRTTRPLPDRNAPPVPRKKPYSWATIGIATAAIIWLASGVKRGKSR